MITDDLVITSLKVEDGFAGISMQKRENITKLNNN